jgi:citrate lyase beta subunit
MRTVLHFVPYASAELLRKALLLKADALVLDLEDSVTPDNKDAARATITDWLSSVDFGGRERIVRINAIDSEWGPADVAATIRGRPDGYLVPKAGDLGELRELDTELTRLEQAHGYPAGGAGSSFFRLSRRPRASSMCAISRFARAWSRSAAAAADSTWRRRSAPGGSATIMATCSRFSA